MSDIIREDKLLNNLDKLFTVLGQV